MGVATFTPDTLLGDTYWGNFRVARGTVGFTGTYSTGGDTLDKATELGMTQVFGMLVGGTASLEPDAKAEKIIGANGVTSGRSFLIGNSSTVPTVVAYVNGAQVANATDITALTFYCWIFGI